MASTADVVVVVLLRVGRSNALVIITGVIVFSVVLIQRATNATATATDASVVAKAISVIVLVSSIIVIVIVIGIATFASTIVITLVVVLCR